jgi:hypothetical protein
MTLLRGAWLPLAMILGWRRPQAPRQVRKGAGQALRPQSGQAGSQWLCSKPYHIQSHRSSAPHALSLEYHASVPLSFTLINNPTGHPTRLSHHEDSLSEIVLSLSLSETATLMVNAVGSEAQMHSPGSTWTPQRGSKIRVILRASCGPGDKEWETSSSAC